MGIGSTGTGGTAGEAADGMVGEAVGEVVGESSSLPQEETRAATTRMTVPVDLAYG
ncbi:hypothetical protein [Streptosporangium lutulentum]|uniref:Uncharacterized protein n=1 Tax=Streptosporangium lutulentum TaxID=1461250 RepID=A0ABT9QS70_9ACTN|nr:hypothetical protein [Streptosporangium lutulentum]MDP9849261.1 hypothetical protein [Streptosporangium lutulentum]